ncbi:MAG: biosynthetic-type acetolactate synthase large subunit [Bacteroidales bacterium]|nr:biosynthetic-type acetolactate synthase large subunit [Bacteroidales bacterium]
MANEEMISGSEMLMRILQREGVEYVFGYPGGSIMPVYDALYRHQGDIPHILTRHEQGAIHAAEGYARVSGKPGVVFSTSGPGATNLVTGMADALADSTPLVIITGQVDTEHLGFDAFQETDVVGMSLPVTKWSYQIRKAEDVAWAVARAFYVASTGRPGPVVLDFTHTAQCAKAVWDYHPCTRLRSYAPVPEIQSKPLAEAAVLLNSSRKPLILAGHGVALAKAEKQLAEVAEKIDAPVGLTLLGLSALPSSHPLCLGMAGMHGNIPVNIATNQADVILAVGMRFDNRVTGATEHYARQAKIIHIDIDETEFNKSIPADVAIHADAREALDKLLPLLRRNEHADWRAELKPHAEAEERLVIQPETAEREDCIHMGAVVSRVSAAFGDDAIVVTDVGLNQMMSARYSRFTQPDSIVTSGGLGTMGFGLPAAIGAKLARPDREVVLFLGDGGFQMTMQELGTIMEHNLDIKIVLLNNNFLGNVRQMQAMFCERRFSATPLANPDFMKIASAYGIASEDVERPEQLDDAIARMAAHKGAFLLNVNIDEENMVFPITRGGDPVDTIYVNLTDRYQG